MMSIFDITMFFSVREVEEKFLLYYISNGGMCRHVLHERLLQLTIGVRFVFLQKVKNNFPLNPKLFNPENHQSKHLTFE